MIIAKIRETGTRFLQPTRSECNEFVLQSHMSRAILFVLPKTKKCTSRYLLTAYQLLALMSTTILTSFFGDW